VAQYDYETDEWTALGEKLSKVNDIMISGTTLYACGDFSLGSRVNPIQNMAQRSLDANPRSLWQTIDFPTVGVDAFPVCNQIFKPAGNSYNLIIRDVASTIQWQLSNKNWTNVPGPGEGNADSNLRGFPLSPNAPIPVTSMKYEGGFIYAHGRFFIGDGTEAFQVVRTSDGVTWTGVLRLPTDNGYGQPVFYYSVIGNNVYWVSEKDENLTESGGAIFTRANLWSSAISSGVAAPSKLGDYLSDFGFPSDASKNMLPVGNTLVVLSPSGLLQYTEGLVNHPNFQDFRHFRRLDTGLSQINADGSGGWTAAFGGGLTASGATVTPTQLAVGADGFVFAIGNFDAAWDNVAYGMAAYNEDKKAFASFGHPLRDDTSALALAHPYPATPTVRTVHVYTNADGHQTVIIGGEFARLNNRTVNSIATTQSGDGADGLLWNAMGAGLTGTTSTNILHLTVEQRPGQVNTITSHPRSSGTGQVIYVGGNFAASGSVGLNNVARFELGGDGSGAWTGLMGGVSGTVSALDSADRRYVFVGGDFIRAGNISTSNVAIWDDQEGEWIDMRGGVDGTVRAIYARGPKNVLVGGAFTVAGGVTVSNLALWDGNIWKSVGCDECGSDCQANGLERTCTIGPVLEIKEIKGRVYLRTTDGLLEFTRDFYTVFKAQTTTSTASGEQRLAPASRDSKGQVWFTGASGSAAVNTYFNQITEYNVDNLNIYPVRGGFNAIVRGVSPASALAPIAGLAVLIATMLALLM
jgi:hypothetical protein